MYAGLQRAHYSVPSADIKQASCQGGVYGDKTPGKLTSTAWLPLYGCMQGVAQGCLNSAVWAGGAGIKQGERCMAGVSVRGRHSHDVQDGHSTPWQLLRLRFLNHLRSSHLVNGTPSLTNVCCASIQVFSQAHRRSYCCCDLPEMWEPSECFQTLHLLLLSAFCPGPYGLDRRQV